MLLILATLCAFMALTLINHAGMCTTHAMMNHRVHPQEGKERNYLLETTKCHSITVLLFLSWPDLPGNAPNYRSNAPYAQNPRNFFYDIFLDRVLVFLPASKVRFVSIPPS